MDDSEDVKKIDEIIRKHKIEAQDPDELEYAEFNDSSDSNDEKDSIDIDEDYEIPIFPKSDITKFNTYTPSQFLSEDEKRVIESCPDPELKHLLLLNRNKNIQLMQLYKKIKDLLMECQKNIFMKEKFIDASKNAKRMWNKIWRLGIPYFKTKDDFPCPRNDDIVKKHKDGELLFYDMSPSNKWLDKDMNRLLKGVAFYYKIEKERELEQNIKVLEKELTAEPDSEKEEIVQELKNDLEDIKNSEASLYPPLNCDKHINWDRIAAVFLKDRYSGQDCQIFWNNYLHPDINKKPWTTEENKRLKTLVAEYNCQNWDLIAAELGDNRTGYGACVHYFSKVDPPRQGRFSEAEDKLLKQLVDKHKQGEYIPWTEIAHNFKHRTRGQLFYRFKYFLSCRNGMNKGKFTEAEDILILVLVNRFGKKFSKCGKYIPNRSVVQIKARYFTNLRGALKKGSFSFEEDKEILEHVEKCGPSKWEPLVTRLNRCGSQVRQRYRTLKTFLDANPGVDVKKAPRRRYSTVAFDSGYQFLKVTAERFKNYEKIPTLQEVEKILATQKSTTATRAEPNAKTYGSRSKKIPSQGRRKSLGHGKERVEPDVQVSPPASPEGVVDIDETFPHVILSVDNLLVDFFSNSSISNLGQSVNRQRLQRAAAVAASVLSTFRAELHIPHDFAENERLDALDREILKILTAKEPVNANGEYVLKRENLEIDKLIPPTLNTVIGMRSLLVKNQIFKTKRAYIFESFRTECKEKQVQWCITNHLVHQPEDTQQLLLFQRSLFFKRFVSMYKFPAMMTLEKPSELLETSAKAWRNEFTMGVKTYVMKKSRPGATEDESRNDTAKFESVFLTQSAPDGEPEHVDPVAGSSSESDTVINGGRIRHTDPEPKLSMVERLKRKISDTIDKLSVSPPPKKHYRDIFQPIPVKDSCAFKNTGSESRPKVRTVEKPAARKTYTPKRKIQSKVEAVVESASRKGGIKIENQANVNREGAEAHSRFNLGKGELVLETESPGSSGNGSGSLNQDLMDLTALDAVLKRERNVVEESFDF